MTGLRLALAFLLLGPSLFAAEETLPRDEKNLSLRHEVQLALDKALSFLRTQQREDGSWSATTPNHPALTALPLIAFQREPSGGYLREQPDFLKKGYAFLRSKVQPDGGIYTAGLSNYNTSLALVALLHTGDAADAPLVTAAHDFIVNQQASGMFDPALDGGISYGPTGTSRQHPDLDNTLVGLEALRAYREARAGTESAGGRDLNWPAAIAFVSRCQNLAAENKATWVSEDAANKGGFIYFPGDSKAGKQDLGEGRTALRSYGTMSYAGLLSMVFAEVKRDDPRVLAVLEWLQRNYTLEENPGLQRAGLFYYYHLLTKGLAAAGVNELVLSDGRKVDWTKEVALKLVALQNADGSWANDNARWMEKDPSLVTSYCVLALEIIYRRL